MKAKPEDFAKKALDQIRGSSSDPEMWDRVHDLVQKQHELIEKYNTWMEGVVNKGARRK